MPVINVTSDIHLEFGKYVPAYDSEMQALVIAGDLAPGLQGIEFLEELEAKSKAPIIYVPGNHCLWGRNFEDQLEFLKKNCDRIGVHFLYNESVTINDTVYLGTSLWTDFNANNNQVLDMVRAQMAMNDYKNMFHKDVLLTPQFLLDEHKKAVEFIVDGLNSAPSTHKTCVVTHHAPCLRSLGHRRGHSNSPFYASDLSSIINELQPDLWVHGHIHESIRYVEGETLIVCNPRGYHGVHLNPDFIPDILIEF
jgi:Icc-related predicted phosphoesterase